MNKSLLERLLDYYSIDYNKYLSLNKDVNLANFKDGHEFDDIDKAVKANHQLQHPSYKHSGREAFFRSLEKGETFRTAAFKAMPKDSIKQSMKYLLIKFHLIKDTGGGFSITMIYK